MTGPLLTRGRATDRTPVQVRWEPVRVGLATIVVVWLASRLARLTVVLVRTPALLTVCLVLAGLAVVWRAAGLWLLVVVVVAVAAALVGWRLRWPHGFALVVGDRVRSLGRWFWTYRRCWQPAMVTANLAQVRDGGEFLPELLGVRSSRWVDRVRVRLLPGQTLADWADKTPRLAQSFGVASCRVHSTGRVQVVEVWALRRDPLTDPAEPASPAESWRLDLGGLPVGRQEDGSPFRLGLLGQHVLVVGATGSGKGSVLWSLIQQLSPGITGGRVALWVIDPKGGMELAPGQALYARFAHGTTPAERDGNAAGVEGWEDEFARLLEDAVQVMRGRQDRLRGVTRLHEPVPGDPLIVVVVDELASLTAYVTDRTLKRRIEAALSLLLSQGRAVGVSVVAAVQDPRKETIPVRDLFPVRVCLRVTEPEHATLTLGAGVRARGAYAEQIPHSLPGVGYVQIDGHPEPARVRFAHVTDEHIVRLVAQTVQASRPALTIAGDHDDNGHDGDGDSEGWAVA